jgi:hypothetical protein
MRKQRINLYITQRQKKQLEKRSQEENLLEAEIIRRALDIYLAWDDPTYATPAPDKERRLHPHSSSQGLSAAESGNYLEDHLREHFY